ncbi:Rcs stress response system protein RcsF [Shigella flexneri]
MSRIRSKPAPQPKSGTYRKPKAPRTAAINLYQCRRIHRRTVRDLGEDQWRLCRPLIRTLRPAFQPRVSQYEINTSKMKANAVLLHSCEVTGGTRSCMRQAVCIGSALNITAEMRRIPVRANRRYSLAL